MKLDFSHPMQSRKWLNLLREDSLSGIRIKPNLNLSRNELGFTFKTNEIGLRGKLNQSSNKVVGGTSFAMGFGVDENRNWFDQTETDFFNIGLPVGPREHLNLLNEYYKGNYSHLIYMYHPNFWSLANQYNQLDNNYDNLFSNFGWEKNWFKCKILSFRKKNERSLKIRKGEYLVCETKNGKYFFNSNYCYFDFNTQKKEVTHILTQFKDLTKLFDNVTIIRIPIKEILLQENSLKLNQLKPNLDFGWNQLMKSLDSENNIRIFEPDFFDVGDYLPFDTHWNEKGNLKFANFFNHIND